MLHETKLSSKLGMSEQSFVSVYRIYSVSIDNIVAI
jgi:hypothetical protein